MQINTSQSSLNKFLDNQPVPVPLNTQKVEPLSGVVLLAAQSKINGNSSLGVQPAYDLGLSDCPHPKAIILDTEGTIPNDPNAPVTKFSRFRVPAWIMSPKYVPLYLKPIIIMRYLQDVIRLWRIGKPAPSINGVGAIIRYLREILDEDDLPDLSDLERITDYSDISLKCGCPDPLATPINLIEHDNIEETVDILRGTLPVLQNGIKFHSINDIKSLDSYKNILKTLLEDTSISTKVKINSYLGALDAIGNMLLDGASTQQTQAKVNGIIEGIKVVGFLGSGLSANQIEQKRQTLDLIKNQYQSAIRNIDDSPVLNLDDIDVEDIRKMLQQIQLVGEKQCLGDLVLNDDCDCVCPEGKIKCPENNTCIDCNNENGGLVVIKVGHNGTTYCDCDCVEDKKISVMVETTNFCIDPCPEGTTFQWLDCDDPLVGRTLTHFDYRGNITKCYGCICCKRNQPPGLQYIIPCTKMNALNCPNNAVRSGSDCKCNCIEPYIKVLSPYDFIPLSPDDSPDNDFRCIKRCPPGKVYIWASDSCECLELARESNNGTFKISVNTEMACFNEYSKVWDNEYCRCICPDGAIYNTLSEICECPEGTILFEGECVTDDSGSGSGEDPTTTVPPPPSGSGSGS